MSSWGFRNSLGFHRSCFSRDVIIPNHFIPWFSNFSLLAAVQKVSVVYFMSDKKKTSGVKFFVLNFSYLLTDGDTLGKWLGRLNQWACLASEIRSPYSWSYSEEQRRLAQGWSSGEMVREFMWVISWWALTLHKQKSSTDCPYGSFPFG